MLTFLTILFSVAMVLVSLVLILLVLIQLPKKEAGAGLAFGGGASDALFGAGAGNVLTKITKIAAAAFFIIALVLSVMKGREKSVTTSEFSKKLQSLPAPAPQAPPVVTPGTNTPVPALTATNIAAPLTIASNTAASATSNAPAGTNAPKK